MKSSSTDRERATAQNASIEDFDAVFQHYAPKLHGFLARRGASTSQAEELVQEVMLSVWDKRASFDASKASLSTWIYSIARNKHVDRIRRERRPEPDPDDPCWVPSAPHHAEQPDLALSQAQRREPLRAAVADLDVGAQQLLAMLYVDGQSMSEAAAALGIPLGTVKTRVRKAIGTLRTRVGEED